MIKQRLMKVSLILGLLCLVAGCSTTKSLGIWKDPNIKGKQYKNIIVIGVADRDGIRRVFEDEFVKQLQAHDIKAIVSYTMFSLNKINKETIKAQMKKKGIDAVIVTRMVDKTTEQKYYPPTMNYAGPPRAYYGGWYNYAYTGYAYYSSPGYNKTYDVVKLECNVYDFAEEKLVFSGLSKTTISKGNEANAGSIVKALIKSFISN